MRPGKAPTSAPPVCQVDHTDLYGMVDALPVPVLVSDACGLCRRANAAYRTLSGLDDGQIAGAHWSDHVSPSDRPALLAQWREQCASIPATGFVSESRLLRADGDSVWTQRSIMRLDDTTLIHTLQDIHAHKVAEQAWQTAEAALTAEKDRIQVTLDSIGDAVVTTDALGCVTYVNVVAERMTGWDRARAIGRPLDEVFNIIDAASREPATNPAMQAISENRTVALAANCVLLRSDGTEVAIEDSAAPLRDRDGVATGAVLVFHDARLAAATTSRMAYLAHHDELTGLPNRTLFREHLAQALKLAHRHGNKAGIMFIDLDNFKYYNDTLGHPQGDALLVCVARRLVKSVRDTDTVCRYGGDEFLILLGELQTSADAERVAEKIRTTLSEPLLLDGQRMTLSMSVGISIYPEHGNDADTLLRNADTAMYLAKKDAGVGHMVFDQRQVRGVGQSRRSTRFADESELTAPAMPRAISVM